MVASSKQEKNKLRFLINYFGAIRFIDVRQQGMNLALLETFGNNFTLIYKIQTSRKAECAILQE
jgi:hypothetical protein